MPTCDPSIRSVVAVVLHHRGRIALLRRSGLVGSDVGLWHCVTGYLEPDAEPVDQAWREVDEETRLTETDGCTMEARGVLRLRDAKDVRWDVHTFALITPRAELVLNWEHDQFCWTSPDQVSRLSCVPWLTNVLRLAR